MHASLATNTLVRIEIHDAVGALVHRRDGADFDARRIFAMIAARYLEIAARVREATLFHVLNPSPVHPNRNLVFRLAGHGTGVAADALAIVDYKAVFHIGQAAAWKTGSFRRNRLTITPKPGFSIFGLPVTIECTTHQVDLSLLKSPAPRETRQPTST
ncbi:MAG TPA: hypothetical protein VMR62_34450 [Bryobacteraceae bacterium]|nr:hypothetical protein [Bryobacteraceae bacterium]